MCFRFSLVRTIWVEENGELKKRPWITDPRNYEIENQLDIGIKENLYLEGEIARYEMGFSPTEYYEMPGTREYITIDQKIPLCKCDVIAINRIRKEKAGIIANEEYIKNKSKEK